LARTFGSSPGPFPHGAQSRLEQFLTVPHNYFDILKKLFQIHVVSVFGLFAHGFRISAGTQQRNGVFTLENAFPNLLLPIIEIANVKD